LDLVLDASIEMTRADGSNYYTLDQIETSVNFAFGAGYKLHDKYSVEIRYQTGRDILTHYMGWGSDYHSLSFILGYTIF